MVRSAAKPSEKLRVLQMQWNTLQNGYEIQFAGKQPASLATLTAHLKHNISYSKQPASLATLTAHLKHNISYSKQPASLATLTAHLKHNVSYSKQLAASPSHTPYTTRGTCRAGRHRRDVSYVYTKRTLSPMESRVGEV
jgi:hypothetical protein